MSDFEEGKNTAHLESIDRTLGNIQKTASDHNESDVKEFKSINDKIDEVKDKAQDAAKTSYFASQKIDRIEKTQESRHKENVDHMTRIEEKVDKLSRDNSELKSSISGIKGWATGASFVLATVGGLAGAWVKDKIIKS